MSSNTPVSYSGNQMQQGQLFPPTPPPELPVVTSTTSSSTGSLNNDKARQIINRIYSSDPLGLSSAGLKLEQQKPHWKTHTRRRYNIELAKLTVFVLDMIDRMGENEASSAEMTDLIIDSEVFNIASSFTVYRAFAAQEIDDSQNNTCGDGYCMFGGTQQCLMRGEDGYSVADLKNFDCQRNVLDGIVPHLLRYVDLVHPTDANSRIYTSGLLKSTLNHAITNPLASNPLNNWGNAMCIPFLDFTVMLLDFQTNTHVIVNGVDCFYGVLARVNFALSGGKPDEDCIPQFSFRELIAMFNVVNYLGYLPGHFFLLENPLNELQNAIEAVRDFINKFLLKIRSLSSVERACVREFESFNGSILMDLMSSSSSALTTSVGACSLVDLSMDDDDDDDDDDDADDNNLLDSSLQVTPTKAFSFVSDVPPTIEERNTLLQMVISKEIFHYLFSNCSVFN
jgi:hypothetical protein